MSKDKTILDKNQKTLLFLYHAHQRHEDLRSEPTLNVSIDLSKAIYRDKLITTFTVYLALKFIARTGRIGLSEAIRLSADTLGHKDTRSVKKALKHGLDMNWFGTDGTWLFIRGFHFLERMYGIDSRKAGVLKYSELTNVREWIIGYTLGRRFKDLTSVKKARTTQRKDFEKATTVSITIISRELGLSRGASCELKKRASRVGYFSYRNRIEETGIDPDDVHHARKVLDDDGLFIQDGKVIRKLPSVFEFNTKSPGRLKLLHFKRRNRVA